HTHARYDKLFDLRRRQRLTGAFIRAALVLLHAAVVAVLPLPGRRRRHGRTAAAVEQALEEVDAPLFRGLFFRAERHRAGPFVKELVDSFEHAAVHDRLVLAGVALIAAGHEPGVDRIAEDAQDHILAPGFALLAHAVTAHHALRPPLAFLQFAHDREQGPVLLV